MRLSELLGQETAVGILERMLETRRVPHSLLFHGPEGVGKATAAQIFAGTLLCAEGSVTACGNCESCRRVGTENHPDLLRIGILPREGTAKTADAPVGPRTRISIEQIRELSRLAGLSPRQGLQRIFIVDPADRMSHEAQNALLKTLEEPPARSSVILVASRPQLLLATVRSRCFALGFGTLAPSTLRRLLERRGLAPDEAAERALLGDGRVGKALALDRDAARERRGEVRRMLELLTAPEPALQDLSAMAAALAGKDEPTLQDGLDVLEALVRDAARAGVGRVGPVPACATLAPERAASLVASIERARGYMRVNTNRLLIAESLLAGVAGGPLP